MLKRYVALAMFTTIFIRVHFYFQLKEQHLPTVRVVNSIQLNPIRFDLNRSHSEMDVCLFADVPFIQCPFVCCWCILMHCRNNQLSGKVTSCVQQLKFQTKSGY